MANGDYKYLNRRTAADKVLHDKAFNITKIPKYQCGLDSMVYNFFHKKTSGWAIKKGIMQDEELAKELHQPIIKKFGKRKVHLLFIDNFAVLILQICN